MAFDPLDELIADLEQALPRPVNRNSAAGFAELIRLTDRAINGPLAFRPMRRRPRTRQTTPKRPSPEGATARSPTIPSAGYNSSRA
jgi:hypothetical protein